MDRSGVRQSIVRQSYVFNNGASNLGRSFISTAIASDSVSYGDDLRKSRIQNLPNYKKTNLGENIQFIVVFQTIQIERLSQEIEVLRVRIKQYQRQLFNAQNYEVQIRELTERCFTQEKEIYEYREEYEKLNKICQTLYHENEMLKNKLNDMDFSLKQKYESEKNKNAELTQEIQKWKVRYQASERSKNKQLDDLRAMMESQRKSMIDRQIREMTVRFQNERSGLESQIRKCRQLLDNRARQIDDYRQKCQKYQICIMQLRNNENVIADYENKIALINQELLRLNEVLRDRQDVIQNHKNNEFKLSQKLKELQEWEFQGKQLRQTLEIKSKEADQWKTRVSRLEQQVTRGRQLEHYNSELGNKLNLASKELQRLNGILRMKMDQIDQWKRKVNEREAEISKFKNLQNEIFSYQSKINNMKLQNDRINGILKSRLGQIEEWKGRYNSVQDKLTAIDTLNKQKKMLENRCGQQIKYNQELTFKINKLQNEMNNFRKSQNQFKQIERNNIGLSKELERLNGLLKNQSGELNDYRVRYSKLESSVAQYRSIDLKVRDYETKINLLTSELQKLNDLLKDRNREISEMEKEKLELHSKINHYKNYQIKINQNQQAFKRLQEGNNALKRELDGWQGKHREGQSKIRQMQNHLFKSTQQKQKLSSMIKVKNNEYDQLRTQYSRLQPEIRQKKEIEVSLQEHQNHIIQLSTDIQGYERRLKTYEQQIEKEKAFGNQFAYKIIVLSAEIQRLNLANKGMSKVKSKQYEELQQHFSRLQTKVTSKNAEIDGLVAKITSIQSKLTTVSNDYNRLFAAVQRSEQESVKMIKQIQEYQDYARRINILDAQIDRLRGENKALDEDIKRMRLKYADSINHEKREEANNMRLLLMAVQIESLRKRVDQRQINVDELRKSILEPVRRI